MKVARGAVILLVDDDPNDLLFIRQALLRAGVTQTLRDCCDGDEACSYLGGTGRYANRLTFPLPCLILLDLKMPKKNGLEVLSWLRGREQLADIPVVMVSSSDDPKDQIAAGERGVDAFLVKPVTFEALVTLAHDIRRRADVHCAEAKPCRST